MELQLQRQKAEGPEVKKPNLTGIPTQMKLNFERRSGLSFDDVRVHYNSDKPARLGALAYTQGTQIHVGPGQERSLPHELGHVIQQKAGRVRPTRWIGGLPVNDQPELEHEADLAPVQCMPAPALWGVVQMELDIIPHQSGCNCGYHALARALLKIDPAHCGDKADLERRLTSFAIQSGYSVIGEAFDPYTLACVGASFCAQEHIAAQCILRTFHSRADFGAILASARNNNGVVLVPYRPNKDRESADFYGPTAGPDAGGAHWGDIDVGTAADPVSTTLYEGNRRGSLFLDQNTQSRTYGQTIHLSPLAVTPAALIDSNQAIPPQFDWDDFLTNAKAMVPGRGGKTQLATGLDAVNAYKERVVVDSTAANSGAFANEENYQTQIRQVMACIAGLRRPLSAELAAPFPGFFPAPVLPVPTSGAPAPAARASALALPAPTPAPGAPAPRVSLTQPVFLSGAVVEVTAK